MTRLFVIRHGETDANRELRFQGQVDIALNAIGHEQARRLARRIEAVHAAAPIDLLFSSDLIRACETARPSEPVLGQNARVVPTLREQAFGIFDGLSVPEIEARYAREFELWREHRADFALPGGAESTRMFSSRVLAAMGDLARQHSGRTLCVVTHGGVLDMLWRHATGQALDGPRQCEIPNAGINTLRWTDDGRQGRFEILDWADAAHLDGMPPQAVYRQT